MASDELLFPIPAARDTAGCREIIEAETFVATLSVPPPLGRVKPILCATTGRVGCLCIAGATGTFLIRFSEGAVLTAEVVGCHPSVWNCCVRAVPHTNVHLSKLTTLTRLANNTDVCICLAASTGNPNSSSHSNRVYVWTGFAETACGLSSSTTNVHRGMRIEFQNPTTVTHSL